MNAPDLERLRDWEGREEVRDDVIALAPVQALAATLDHDPEVYLDGEILPPLYHWLFFLDLTKLGGLAADGHAEKGGFMPPAPCPRPPPGLGPPPGCCAITPLGFGARPGHCSTPP